MRVMTVSPPPPLALVAHAEAVAELEEAGVPVVAADGHEAALLVHLDAVHRLVTHLRHRYSE